MTCNHKDTSLLCYNIYYDSKSFIIQAPYLLTRLQCNLPVINALGVLLIFPQCLQRKIKFIR